MEFLEIIGEPDEPDFVLHECFILFPSIDIILPFENDNSLLSGYCNIKISWSLWNCLLSISKNCLILSSFNISIQV